MLITGCTGGLDDATSIDPNAGKGYVPPEVAEEIAPAPTLHRLNRIEYNNTVRDLTGTLLRPADNFPPDPVANGFDNMADQLGLNANQFNAYFTAARDVIDDALDDRPVLNLVATADKLNKTGGYAVGQLWALSGSAISVSFEVSEPGTHTVEFVLGGAQIGPAPAPTADLRLDEANLESAAVAGSSAAPQARTFTLELAQGPHSLAIVPTNFVNMAAENTSNNVFVSSIRVTSESIMSAPGRDKIIPCQNLADPACLREVVERFATAAWRRPANADDIDALVSLAQTLIASGESHVTALKLVLRTVLMSPRFLYRARTSSDLNASGWVDPYVLANRLSYFIWSSMPDERLLEAAADGSLTTEAGLSDAVRWMLADSKAESLRDSFAAQWLSVREFSRASPDPAVFPTFDADVKAAMAQESLLLFDDFLASALPASDMLSPGFAYRNDKLAAHYQEAAIEGADMQRVYTTDPQRQGVASLGAWLVARSTPNHASPIRRGAWVSEHVLCQPVPPPPAGLEIPDLDLGAEEGLTVRQQLEQHRSDDRCASCHARLDIVGMGFQLFDASGVRSVDPALDSMGELPDGTTFRGAGEFSNAATARSAFSGCLTEKLYTYALGRGLEPKDTPYLETLSETVHRDALTLAELVDAIVHLPSFRAATPLEELAP